MRTYRKTLWILLWVCWVVPALAERTFSQAAQPLQRSSSPTSNLHRIRTTWLSLRDEFRAILKPLRQPNYEFRILAREQAGGNKEHFALNRLPARIVLVIGGLQCCAPTVESFAVELDREMQFPEDTRVAIFEYPNDGSIRDSALALSALLVEIQKRSPQTKISIVSHSMGGLVARAAIERPFCPVQLDASRIIDRFVMICPPNHGSVLAQYADALEWMDGLRRLQKKSDSSIVDIAVALVDDGLGEACSELVPGSILLQELSLCSRVPGVDYCIIAGTKGPIAPWLRVVGSIALEESLARIRREGVVAAEVAMHHAAELIESDELTLGLGDGAVSLKSAALLGVNTFDTFPIHHAQWCEVSDPNVRAMLQFVADRLKP